MRFLVCKDLQEADEDISEYGDGSVILCTNGYTIYEDIEETEGDGHLAVTHSDTYVIGDAHTNTSFSDTYLRPVLIGRTGAFNSATIVIGIFGGLVVFGAVGPFIGPVVLGGAKLVLDSSAREHTGESTARVWLQADGSVTRGV